MVCTGGGRRNNVIALVIPNIYLFQTLAQLPLPKYKSYPSKLGLYVFDCIICDMFLGNSKLRWVVCAVYVVSRPWSMGRQNPIDLDLDKGMFPYDA